jgi:hypothetical protein
VAHDRPFQIIGFHSCAREVGLNVLNGRSQLKPSNNIWDWLGEGIYFWEQNPKRALEYSIESAREKQFNKIPIKTPLVLGAIIELGNCLNLIEPESITVLRESYKGLEQIYREAGKQMPKNEADNRKLDSAVFKHLHKSRKENSKLAYETIRCAFAEGQPIYPGANFTSRLHIEICVLNPILVKGYFLPFPLEEYNPYLRKEFV